MSPDPRQIANPQEANFHAVGHIALQRTGVANVATRQGMESIIKIIRAVVIILSKGDPLDHLLVLLREISALKRSSDDCDVSLHVGTHVPL